MGQKYRIVKREKPKPFGEVAYEVQAKTFWFWHQVPNIINGINSYSTSMEEAEKCLEWWTNPTRETVVKEVEV